MTTSWAASCESYSPPSFFDWVWMCLFWSLLLLLLLCGLMYQGNIVNWVKGVWCVGNISQALLVWVKCTAAQGNFRAMKPVNTSIVCCDHVKKSFNPNLLPRTDFKRKLFNAQSTFFRVKTVHYSLDRHQPIKNNWFHAFCRKSLSLAEFVHNWLFSGPSEEVTL